MLIKISDRCIWGITFRRPHDKNSQFLYLIEIINFFILEVKEVCASIISIGYIKNWTQFSFLGKKLLEVCGNGVAIY